MYTYIDTIFFDKGKVEEKKLIMKSFLNNKCFIGYKYVVLCKLTG